jgi:hypothetical protein
MKNVHAGIRNMRMAKVATLKSDDYCVNLIKQACYQDVFTTDILTPRFIPSHTRQKRLPAANRYAEGYVWFVRLFVCSGGYGRKTFGRSRNLKLRSVQHWIRTRIFGGIGPNIAAGVAFVLSLNAHFRNCNRDGWVESLSHYWRMRFPQEWTRGQESIWAAMTPWGQHGT